MLTTITLGGHLGEQFGRDWHLDLDTPSPAEAVRALCAVCKGFKAYVLEHAKPGYHVFRGEENLGKDDLAKPTGSAPIHIIPALVGAVDKSIWQIIGGGVLIAAGVVVGLFGTVLLGGATIPIAGSLISMGAGMAFSGVSTLLAGQPDPAEKDKAEPNYIFSGPANTTGVGAAIPVVYGQLEIGSQFISATISTASIVNDAIASDDTDGNPPIGRWHFPHQLP